VPLLKRLSWSPKFALAYASLAMVYANMDEYELARDKAPRASGASGRETLKACRN
jgi:hypothetical protein